MNTTQLTRTTAAVIALVAGIGFAQAQTGMSPTVTQTQQPSSGSDARAKPAPTTTGTPTTVMQTQQPSSGMEPKMKPSPKTTAVSPTITQTQQPSSGMSPSGSTSSTAMASGDKPMKKESKPKRMTGEPKPSAKGVGSGSAGTTEGRVEGTTNSNSMGEPAKKP